MWYSSERYESSLCHFVSRSCHLLLLTLPRAFVSVLVLCCRWCFSQLYSSVLCQVLDSFVIYSLLSLIVKSYHAFMYHNVPSLESFLIYFIFIFQAYTCHCVVICDDGLSPVRCCLPVFWTMLLIWTMILRLAQMNTTLSSRSCILPPIAPYTWRLFKLF